MQGSNSNVSEDDQPCQQRERKGGTRTNNGKAQKKYRAKKQMQQREIEENMVLLARKVLEAEAERDVLSYALGNMELELRGATFKSEPKHQVHHEPIYIPAVDGYDNLRVGEKPGLLLRAVYSPPKRWTYAEAMELSVEDFCLIRKDIVLMAGRLLLANPSRDLSIPDGQHLKELMREAHGITAYLALNRQQLLYQLQDCRMDTQETNVPAPDEAFWGSILRQLNLSKKQELALVGNYAEMRDTNRKLFAERELLGKTLVHIDICKQLPSFPEGPHHYHDQIYFACLVRKLQENLDNQHLVKSKFNGINIFQDAQLMTMAWPWYHRITQVVTQLAEKHGVLQSAEAADRAAELQQVDVEDGLEEPYVPSGTKLIEDYSQDQFRKISIY